MTKKYQTAWPCGSPGRGKKAGFTLMEIMIVVAFLTILAMIALPAYSRARATSQKTACINNLRVINSGKEVWALENGMAGMDLVDITEIDGYCKNGMPTCPAGGTYSLTFVDDNPTCSVAGHVLPP